MSDLSPELQAAVDQAKKNTPDIELLLMSSESIEALFRTPTAAEAGVFRKRVADKDTRSSAIENLVRTCLVYPAKESFNAVVQRRPFLVETWGEKLLNAAGDAEEVEVKKL